MSEIRIARLPEELAKLLKDVKSGDFIRFQRVGLSEVGSESGDGNEDGDHDEEDENGGKEHDDESDVGVENAEMKDAEPDDVEVNDAEVGTAEVNSADIEHVDAHDADVDWGHIHTSITNADDVNEGDQSGTQADPKEIVRGEVQKEEGKVYGILDDFEFDGYGGNFFGDDEDGVSMIIDDEDFEPREDHEEEDQWHGIPAVFGEDVDGPPVILDDEYFEPREDHEEGEKEGGNQEEESREQEVQERDSSRDSGDGQDGTLTDTEDAISTKALYYVTRIENDGICTNFKLTKLQLGVTDLTDEHRYQVYGDYIHFPHTQHCSGADCEQTITVSDLAGNSALDNYTITVNPSGDYMRRSVLGHRYCPANCADGFLQQLDDINQYVPNSTFYTLASKEHQPICPVCIGLNVLQFQQALKADVENLANFDTLFERKFQLTTAGGQARGSQREAGGREHQVLCVYR
ncbi:hypothetical protein EJ03DRAFT_159035 [Teratosphaeria nubilosa]|uniref:Uncharacterized protein n=1 Tax=Teratosphaeria nubilosa TaxID=161662 RepID=A0A6G1L441_9PEZI|nr:hypothetical protein EJ03DRAFT_159035 [Teratosphaeria nubilosa]